MNEEFEKMRAEFEAWLTTFDGAQVNLNRADVYYGGPHYGSAMTNRAWAAWQASRKQAIKECAALCDNFEAAILEPALQYSGQDVDCYHETAQRCAKAIRGLQKE